MKNQKNQVGKTPQTKNTKQPGIHEKSSSRFWGGGGSESGVGGKVGKKLEMGGGSGKCGAWAELEMEVEGGSGEGVGRSGSG
ncbi:MAG: hypothetical protein PHP74_05005 [Candidatus Gracilibacteria bacterium]|nr:hypothetical protein [Candidatus Gracilibacteria bacterium]